MDGQPECFSGQLVNSGKNRHGTLLMEFSS